MKDPQGLVTSDENGQPLAKTPEQEALEEAFKPNAYVEPMTNAEGQVTNYNVVVTNDITGPVAIPESVENLILDLAGKTLSGTNGVTSTKSEPGTDGGSAVVVVRDPEDLGTKPTNITVADSTGSETSVISGGNGGNGHPAGKGAPAIAKAEDAMDGVAWTADPEALLKDGTDGNEWSEESLTLAETRNRYPWDDVTYNVPVLNTTDWAVVAEADETTAELDNRAEKPIKVGETAMFNISSNVWDTTDGGAAKVDYTRNGEPYGTVDPAFDRVMMPWTPVVDGLYAFTLTPGGDTAQFEAVFPANVTNSFPQESFDIVWDPKTDTIGAWKVTLKENLTGPLAVADDIGNVILDMNGHVIAGTNAVSDTGEDGGNAIVFTAMDPEEGIDQDTRLRIIDTDPRGGRVAVRHRRRRCVGAESG